jgi:aspartate aminotransferase-like enzyme
LPHRFRRHEVAATALRAGLEAMQLEMFPHPSVWSNTVSCVRTPGHVEPEAVVSRMRHEHGILIGTGLAELRTSTLRIGTMGITASPSYVLPTLGALELTLRDLGFKADPGAGVAAAQRVFAERS